MATDHIMLDIETLDTKPTAVVLSIGAVRFNPNGSGIDDSFYAVLDVQEQIDRGRTISGITLKWWNEQNEAARKVFSEPQRPIVPVLNNFNSFITGFNVCIWGNGADFDNVIVGSLYDSFQFGRMWSYGKNRCYRTVRELAAGRIDELPRSGTHHNALDYASYQALSLQQYLRSLNL